MLWQTIVPNQQKLGKFDIFFNAIFFTQYLL